MKFTNSMDGVPRANVRISLRFGEREIHRFQEIAKESDEHWRDWLRHVVEDAICSAIVRYYDERRK